MEIYRYDICTKKRAKINNLILRNDKRTKNNEAEGNNNKY